MADKFEVLNLGEIEQELRIEVDAGAGCIGEAEHPDTYIYVKPPVEMREHSVLRSTFSPDTEIGRMLSRTFVENKEHWTRFTVQGNPSQEHADMGIELAKELITLRGIKAGKVVAAVDGKTESHLVLSN